MRFAVRSCPGHAPAANNVVDNDTVPSEEHLILYNFDHFWQGVGMYQVGTNDVCAAIKGSELLCHGCAKSLAVQRINSSAVRSRGRQGTKRAGSGTAENYLLQAVSGPALDSSNTRRGTAASMPGADKSRGGCGERMAELINDRLRAHPKHRRRRSG